MGNYKDLETDFIERTLDLISQYEDIKHIYDSEKQYNHTLLINCLLGLIVFPKEKAISYLPKERINKKLKEEMEIPLSTFNSDYTDLTSLILALRNSIAHFNIEFESNNDDFLIDKIVFKKNKREENNIVATFVPTELLSFIRYYGNCFVSIVRTYK